MRLSIRPRALGALLSLGFCALFGVPSAHAATSVACTGGGFSLVLPSGAPVGGGGKVEIPGGSLPSHGILKVRGKYIDFDVDVSTLGVYNYTLKATDNPLDITGGVTTVLFTRKEPILGTATLDGGTLRVENKDGELRLIREGQTLKMKIQAKDCAQGGIFQLEPELASETGTIDYVHTLGPAVFYFTNPYTGKINFGNANLIRGKDSPQVAAKLVQDERETVWRVTSGGRMGGVLGEDAIENSPPATPCTQSCQAQNQVHGRYEVPDPVYESDGGED
ncbi:hypothetical protein LZ198_25860 [Myxococcus sp. K15C18031901]|uniref:hypothetical protein n=1 Tax=Myxococcus dinghuensis TaxID=2906761 RepID=UPI0020A7E3DB|nr:hypothetical protein [Myxococcus dinghuensis]MCP3102301.1 hypothetical protein [Myxococcus dinghuensis]